MYWDRAQRQRERERSGAHLLACVPRGEPARTKHTTSTCPGVSCTCCHPPPHTLMHGPRLARPRCTKVLPGLYDVGPPRSVIFRTRDSALGHVTPRPTFGRRAVGRSGLRHGWPRVASGEIGQGRRAGRGPGVVVASLARVREDRTDEDGEDAYAHLHGLKYGTAAAHRASSSVSGSSILGQHCLAS